MVNRIQRAMSLPEFQTSGALRPVLSVSEQDILQVFDAVSVNRRTQSIGIVEREIRSGYSGFVFLTAEAI